MSVQVVPVHCVADSPVSHCTFFFPFFLDLVVILDASEVGSGLLKPSI